MKKNKMTGALAGALLVLSLVPGVRAANMMKDPDFNRQPLLPEVSPYGDRAGAKISSYEEDATWNRCVRLDFVKNYVDKNGETNVNVGVLFGGTEKAPGFPVTGGRKYRFGFELKGTSPYVIVIQMSWDAKGNKLEQKATKLNSVHMTPNAWTAYKGELETPADAARTALGLQIWGRGPRYAEVCTPGHYFLVDKVNFEEVTHGRDIWPARALVVPEKGAATVGDFRNLSYSDEPAHYPSEMQVAAEDEGLRFSFAFSGHAPVATATGDSAETQGGVWSEDHVEILLQRKDGGTLHLAVGAAGARWMNGSEPDFGSWQAEAKTGGDGWKCRVRVPWKTLGYEGRPAKGAALRFNAMREAVVGTGDKFDPSKATRSGRGQIFDDSVFAFAGTEVGNPGRFGVLLLGEDPQYGDDASAWWYRNERAKEDARLAKLAREKFVVAQVPPHTNPDIPYLPPELFDPQPVFRLRGAINERVVLPVAVANMTDELEEYRVTLTYGFDQPSPAYEQPMPALGFRREDGTRIGMDHVTMRRGVRFRDSNAPQHGKRYDVLAKMNEVSSVPVAPKEAGLVWIQVDCHGLEPGLYKSEILVTALSGGQQSKYPKASTVKDGRKSYEFFDDSKRIPVEFEVLPFALAEPTDMALQGFHLAQSPYQVAFMSQYDYCCYLVTPWFFDVKVNADGSLAEKTLRSFQEPRLKVLNENVKRVGDLPRAMIAYGVYENFKQFHIGKRNSHIKADTPEFWRAYREWLQFIDETMRANGFGNDDYIVEVFDEPSPKTNTREEIRKAFAEARAAVPKMRLLNTNGERHFFDEIYELTDVWFFSQHVFGLKQCKPMPGKMHAKGGKTSLYACGTEMRQDPYRYYRLLPWKAAAFGGEYVSIYQFFDQVPAASFRQATYGAIAYDTAESVVPSIRLENLYQGMTDIRYLRLLKRTAEAKKGDPVAETALKFARTALWEIPQRYGADATRADIFRDTCVKYLKTLLAK